MNKKTMWLLGIVLMVALASVVLVLAQTDAPQNRTLDDIYRLLTTEDGQNRLDILEQWVADIDREVGEIHTVAARMLDDQYGFFEQEEWTLNDLKFQLDTIELKLQDVLDGSCP